MSYVFSDYLVDDYTVVCWDQRGCGRTYFRNDDKNNSTLSFEMAISDMEVLTSYLKERFSQEKIIIMGHSYGSVLGSAYAYEHPEDCEAFIGVGQFVNFKAASMAAYDVAYQRAKEAGDDTMSMTVAYNTLVYAYSMPARMNLNRYILPYLDSQYHGYTLPDVLFSPYMNSEDFMWTTKTLYYESYMEYEGSLVDHLNYLDLRTEQTSYEVPVMFISGGCDYNCTYTLAEEYASVCGAQIYIIEGADHNCHAACPEEFSQAVKNFLTGL
ncbi:MAG: alpha/beta hydrolase [Saccharofermentans sp.]|nr:alpha/beta hydrolase [Saccharofermentans sp.]